MNARFFTIILIYFKDLDGTVPSSSRISLKAGLPQPLCGVNLADGEMATIQATIVSFWVGTLIIKDSGKLSLVQERSGQ